MGTHSWAVETAVLASSNSEGTRWWSLGTVETPVWISKTEWVLSHVISAHSLAVAGDWISWARQGHLMETSADSHLKIRLFYILSKHSSATTWDNLRWIIEHIKRVGSRHATVASKLDLTSYSTLLKNRLTQSWYDDETESKLFFSWILGGTKEDRGRGATDSTSTQLRLLHELCVRIRTRYDTLHSDFSHWCPKGL